MNRWNSGKPEARSAIIRGTVSVAAFVTVSLLVGGCAWNLTDDPSAGGALTIDFTRGSGIGTQNLGDDFTELTFFVVEADYFRGGGRSVRVGPGGVPETPDRTAPLPADSPALEEFGQPQPLTTGDGNGGVVSIPGGVARYFDFTVDDPPTVSSVRFDDLEVGQDYVIWIDGDFDPDGPLDLRLGFTTARIRAGADTSVSVNLTADRFPAFLETLFEGYVEPFLPPPGGDSPPTLTISSPALTDAETGQSYLFTFTATGLPDSLTQVEFAWTFGTGASGSSGTQQVSVSGNEATHQVSYTYQDEGMFALVVVVEDTLGNVIADKNTVVTVGEATEREFDLDVCADWTATTTGGQGVTVDNWDISTLPVGAEFDIRFDAYSVPDKFVVTYNGSTVLDTGWRGESSYDGDSMYPGGVVGPGSGQEDGIFTKVAGVDTFGVTVFGPQSGTAWEYDVRARCD